MSTEEMAQEDGEEAAVDEEALMEETEEGLPEEGEAFAEDGLAAEEEALPEEEEALAEEEEALPEEEQLEGGEEGADMEEEAGDGDEAPAEVPDVDPAEAQEEPPPEEEPEKEEAPDSEGVQEHLKDAVDGVLRLKRLLSRDGADANAAKKTKLNNGDGVEGPRPIVMAKIKQLLTRWQVPFDLVMNHVLENISVDELKLLIDTNFRPDPFHARKTQGEQVCHHVLGIRERKLGPQGGSRLDVVSGFKFRWKLDLAAEKKLRDLNHKDLRYVMKEYDGETPIEELITQASNEGVDDENTENAAPDRPGLKTISRFNRLELIDPLADAAVFGDANLTFSMLLGSHRKAFGHVGRVIATTFEEIDTLRERYPEIDQSIKILEEHDAEVYHGVDCTRIAVDNRFEGMEGRLGAVYYNFPHSGAIKGFFDGHPMVNWRHENLMRLFFRALRFFVKPGGIVKVSSNAGATGVRFSYIVGGAIENEFHHVETMPFTEWSLHRYGRSYGDKRDTYKRPDAKNNQSYNAQSGSSDMVYCFAYAPTGKTVGKQQIRLPPTLKTLSACTDGPFKNLPPVSRLNLAKQLHARFMTEVSGTHVG